MSEIQESKGTAIDIGVPELEGKDGYFANFLQARTQMGNLLTSSDNITDQKVSEMVDFIISGMTDDEVREQLWGEIDDAVQRAEQDNKGKSNVELARIIRRVYIRKLGDVTSWYDKFLNITKKNIVWFR